MSAVPADREYLVHGSVGPPGVKGTRRLPINQRNRNKSPNTKLYFQSIMLRVFFASHTYFSLASLPNSFLAHLRMLYNLRIEFKCTFTHGPALILLATTSSSTVGRTRRDVSQDLMRMRMEAAFVAIRFMENDRCPSHIPALPQQLTTSLRLLSVVTRPMTLDGTVPYRLLLAAPEFCSHVLAPVLTRPMSRCGRAVLTSVMDDLRRFKRTPLSEGFVPFVYNGQAVLLYRQGSNTRASGIVLGLVMRLW